MKNPIIRTIYLYLFALIGLAMTTFGTARLVNVALRTYVFTEIDRQVVISEPIKGEEVPVQQYNYEKQQRQRDAVNGLSTIIVGLPLWFYHWRIIKKDKQQDD